MITFKEMLGHCPLSDVPIAHQHNIEVVVKRVNIICALVGKPFTVTSGIRTMQDHLRIYSQINAKRRASGKPELNVPMASKHLSGQAVDISDPDGSLYEWCIHNEKVLIENALWIEAKDEAKRVHFQIVPPKSGKRFFNP